MINKCYAYMQCRWWVLACPTLIPFPQVGQVFTTLADQTVNHQAVCTPLAPEKTTVLNKLRGILSFLTSYRLNY